MGNRCNRLVMVSKEGTNPTVQRESFPKMID